MELTDRQKIAHLYRRAGFGADSAQMKQGLLDGYDKTVDRLLHFEQFPDRVPSVAMIQTEESGPRRFQFRISIGQTGEQTMSELPVLPPQQFRAMTMTQRKMHRKEEFQQVIAQSLSWLNRMAATPRPLQEKMALFWHGHFATSVLKVQDATLMQQQIDLFRRFGFDGFETLVQELSKNPAMILWLDSQSNNKAHPNENYPRELMELFTMGLGHYTEEDVREGARCFTGWKTVAGEFFFAWKQHDFGMKTFLGVSGNFNGEDAVRIICRKKATARFITEKVFKFFVYDNPEPQAVDRLAKDFADSELNIRALLGAVFRSPEFLSPRAYRARIKSPVELVAGAAHLLGGTIADLNTWNLANRMGQMLFAPPSVKGWAGGPAWLNTATFFDRFNFATFLVYARYGPLHGGEKLWPQARKSGANTPAEIVDYYSDLLLHDLLSPASRQAIVAYVSRIRLKPRQAREATRLILCTPEFQMA